MDVKAPSTQLPAVRPSPADLAKRINEKYSEIVTSLRTTFMRAVEIGELLEQAKDRVGHGNFEVWLSNHCQLSFSTARRYMKLAEDHPKIEEQLKLESQQSGKSVKLTDLNLTSARRLLAAPKQGSGPPKAEGRSARRVWVSEGRPMLNEPVIDEPKALSQYRRTG